MSTIITVENLGKKYILQHQSSQQPYVALRDVLSDGVRNLGRKLLRRGNTSARDAEKEDFWALKDVSFEVKQGDRIGIIGRNGAGKSTLLKILSRITEPTTGSARIKGRVASLLEVGTGFHPELTGRENIFLNGAILGMSRAEIKKKFDEIVNFAEIEKFLDTPVKRYSSGMYMRLAFAVAAHMEPDIMIVDEVLAVGDLMFQKKCFGKINAVTQQGRTVLLVSHNFMAINAICTSAICLDNGCIVDKGIPHDVTRRYLESVKNSVNELGNLPAHKHIIKSGNLNINQVILKNSKGVQTNTLYFREQYSLTLYFTVRRKVENIRLGFAVCSADGTRISITHHTDSGHFPLSLSEGDYVVEAAVENAMVPGTYFIELGAHDTVTAKGVDSIPEAIQFFVLTYSEDRTVFHDEFNSSYGYLPAIWREVSVSPATKRC